MNGTEAEHLVGALDRMRWTFRFKADGLGRSGLTAGIGASSLTIGGLLKHLAACEDHSFGTKMLGEPMPQHWLDAGWAGSDDWEFTSAADDEPQALYDRYDEAVARARERIAGLLAAGGPGAPIHLSEKVGQPVSLRRLLCDLVEEYGRHTGHADLLREAVDGRVGEDPEPGWRPVGAMEDTAVAPAATGGEASTTAEGPAGDAAQTPVAEFVARDLRGARFQHVELSGATITDANMADVVLRGVHVSGLEIRGGGGRGLRMRGVELMDAVIEGEIHSLAVNGVDVAEYVEQQLDSRDPRRALMRPTTPEGFGQAWDVVEQLWAQTVERARGLDPELLHRQVDGEWSFTQTLRHLAFATDCWVGRMIEQQDSPWHPLDLPWDEAPEIQGVPWDREARPSLDEVLALRRSRTAKVRAVIDRLTPAELDREVTSPETPGFPGADMALPVGECLKVVLREEWHHHQFTERDLGRLTSAE